MRTFKNLTENVQEAITMPYGTDFNRPANPEEGMVRYNTTQDALEFYNGTIWSVLGDSQVTPSEVTDGLFGHWDASNNSSYSGSGSSFDDLTSNGNSLTLNSLTFNSTGVKYFDFNGSNSYMSYSGGSMLKALNSQTFSIVIWLNYDNLGGQVISDMATSNSREISLYADPLKGNIQNGGTVNRPTLSSSLNSNQWYQVSFTYDNSSGSGNLYINSSLEGNASQVVNPDISNHSAFSIGKLALNSSDFFDGKMADIKIYNKALSSEEVTQNFDAKKSTFGL